jgi:hypothetical protein
MHCHGNLNFLRKGELMDGKGHWHTEPERRDDYSAPTLMFMDSMSIVEFNGLSPSRGGVALA